MNAMERSTSPEFNSLLKKFDELMLEVADRLVYPNAGMLGLGKGGVADANCLKRLANLGLAIQQRNVLMSTSQLADILYDNKAAFEAATNTINSVWTTMKTSAIDKGIAIDSAVPLNAAKYGTTNATMKKDMRITFLIHSIEGIDALISSPGCTGHKRLDHFAKNVIGGVQGKLGLAAFKAAAKQWIRDQPTVEDVRNVGNQISAEETLKTMAIAPPPPGYQGRNISQLRAELDAAVAGKNVPSAPVNVAALEARLAGLSRGAGGGGKNIAEVYAARLAALRKGGYRKRSSRGHKRSGRNRKTKRRNH